MHIPYPFCESMNIIAPFPICSVVYLSSPFGAQAVFPTQMTGSSTKMLFDTTDVLWLLRL